MTSTTDQQRVFLAIVPPKEAKEQIRDNNRKFKKHARNFRFVPLDQVHITLQFLGNAVSAETLTAISENCLEIASTTKKIALTLGEPAFGFPGQHIAQVLFYQVSLNPALNSLVKEIHESNRYLQLDDLNKKKDHAKLINHLTFARVKGSISRSYTREVREFINTTTFEPINFEASSFELIASEFRSNPNRTVYSVLKSFELS